MRKPALADNETPVAVVTGDLHLSHTPPPARAGEPSWYDAQGRVLTAIGDLAWSFRVPLIVAGDVFDRWNAPPELINFAADALPAETYAVPGQHDLPCHRLEDIQRSAYWTLVLAGRIQTIKTETPTIVLGEGRHAYGACLYGAPWGAEIPTPTSGGSAHIAIVHRYVWAPGAGYHGAPSAALAAALRAPAGYDLIVTGDNHRPFEAYGRGGVRVFNVGAPMRRRADDDFEPRVGLIVYRAGTGVRVISVPVADADEKWEPTAKDEPAPPVTDFADFLEGLGGLEADALDFADALRRSVAGLPPATAEIVLKVLEESQNVK